jgi:hypothetical protein
LSILSTPGLRVGPFGGPLGSVLPQRGGSLGEAIANQAHGKYFEAAVRGSLFAVANPAAGSAILTGFAAVPPILLSNPIGSGRRLAIKKVSVAYVSGTLGAGAFWHGVYQSLAAAPVVGGGSVNTPVCLGGFSAGITVAKSFTTPTSPATAVGVWPIGSSFAELATTANGLQPLIEDVDGAIVLSPSDSYAVIYVGAAGTSPVICAGIVFEDLPII